MLCADECAPGGCPDRSEDLDPYMHTQQDTADRVTVPFAIPRGAAATVLASAEVVP